jgi:hypothetical protein
MPDRLTLAHALEEGGMARGARPSSPLQGLAQSPQQPLGTACIGLGS